MHQVEYVRGRYSAQKEMEETNLSEEVIEKKKLDQPSGEDVWIPQCGIWCHFVCCGRVVWFNSSCSEEAPKWVELTGSDLADFDSVREEFEKNRIRYFLPHGGGKDFINDWTNGICMLTAPSRAGKSCTGTAFSLLRTIPCDKNWDLFKYHGITYPEYRGPRRLVISSYLWGNVDEVWQEYRKWTPRWLLGRFAPNWGKYRGERGPGRDLTFAGKTQRLTLADGSEFVFLCDSQKQGAWEGKRWDDGHFDEQREKEKWIGYLRGTANTKGLVQAAFTLTGHVLPDRPDTGMQGWIYSDLWLGKYTYGKTVGRYQISMEDVPEAVLSAPRKTELRKQWVEEPQKNQDEDMIRKGKARYFGGWEAGGGLVVESFDPGVHVVPDVDMEHDVCKDTTKYRAVDHGLSRPAAGLWAAMFPWGDLLVYREYFQKGKTVPYHAKEIVRASGNKMEMVGMYEDESTLVPIPTFAETFSGERYDASVLDGRSFSQPSQERATTLGQLYNDCGLYCTAASCKRNKRPDDSDGIIPNMLRMFTIQPDRPHLMWHLWKRRVISDHVYQAWLKGRGGDWKRGAYIYFARSLRWTFEEINKWATDPNTGLPENKNDHLMACLRYITAENPAYRGERWDERESVIQQEPSPYKYSTWR